MSLKPEPAVCVWQGRPVLGFTYDWVSSHGKLSDRSFSEAPTARTFLAVAGDPIESSSTSPSELPSSPALPAEVTISRSGLSHMNVSTWAASTV